MNKRNSYSKILSAISRGDKTLDLLYANVKEAHSAAAHHCLMQLSPVYKPVVRRQSITSRTVQQWTVEAEEALKDCCRMTDWELFQEDHGDDTEGLAHCETNCISFLRTVLSPPRGSAASSTTRLGSKPC